MTNISSKIDRAKELAAQHVAHAKAAEEKIKKRDACLYRLFDVVHEIDRELGLMWKKGAKATPPSEVRYESAQEPERFLEKDLPGIATEATMEICKAATPCKCEKKGRYVPDEIRASARWHKSPQGEEAPHDGKRVREPHRCGNRSGSRCAYENAALRYRRARAAAFGACSTESGRRICAAHSLNTPPRSVPACSLPSWCRSRPP
jgi:hypothetical protein